MAYDGQENMAMEDGWMGMASESGDIKVIDWFAFMILEGDDSQW